MYQEVLYNKAVIINYILKLHRKDQVKAKILCQLGVSRETEPIGYIEIYVRGDLS